jgi:two-component system cell cycle sensor histidine kinase/response regulator CckA
MAIPLRVLLIEDNEDDASLVTRELGRGGLDFSWERVETREAMAEALDRGPWDLILSDFRMPHFSATEALALYRERRLEVPFILVSGTVGEEQAVESLKAGAHDFLLKDRLARLCPAVERALRESENGRARRLAEEELRASEARFKGAFAFSPIGMALVAPDGRFLEVNPALCQIVGYSQEELLTKTFQDITHPDDLEPDLAYVRRVLAGEIPSYQMEKRYLHKQGHVVWALLNVSLLRDKAGQPLHFISQIQDVTERLQTEQMLRQSQKVEAIGGLAGGVAHDFNNLLGVILGYGEMAQRQLGPESPVRARVDQMVKAAERAAGLTRQLLAFSRKQVMQPKLLDLNGLVTDSNKMLGRLIGEDIEVVIQPAPGLGTVNADPGQIEQIIFNLAVNARDAMPKGGRLTLATANVELDAAYAAIHPPATPGRYVMLAVSDTGIGMDAETQRRIFEPFFTTKPEGQGTGLGLATVYGIVKQSGGQIWVYSEPGRGTTFKVYLPRVDGPAEPLRPAGPLAEPARGHETILLVEDTETLREMIQESLEERGYRVLVASNGEEALALARESKGLIDLVLTDVVMPKLGGGDLAKLLSALRPKIRVLYMSGYTNGAISEHGVPGEGVVLLEKPFTAEKLARAVRQALDHRSAT